MALIDFTDRCEGCDILLPIDGYSSFRRYCSASCYMRDYHSLDKAARLEAKKDRPPCICCGKPVAIEKDRRAVYCSETCQKRAGGLRRKLQFEKLCERCGSAFHGCNASQRFCSQWCRAQVDFRKHPPRPCQQCGTTITRPKHAAAKYCSLSCAAYAREATKRNQAATALEP